MTEQEAEDLHCDLLLFIAIPTEEQKLREVAGRNGLRFERRTIAGLGNYFYMGMIGQNKVNAVRTEMGPFSHGGSASRAINFRVATGATGIVQLGMAFGIDPVRQNYGDVLVSTSLIPYDLREVRPDNSVSESLPRGFVAESNSLVENDDRPPNSPESLLGETFPTPAVTRAATEHPYRVDYRHAIRHRSKESLLNMFLAERDRGDYSHRIHFGGMLSGGARIFSRMFLGELIRGVPSADDGIIGGEMEGIGLLSVSPADDPMWIVVKGISDFADEHRDEVIRQTRPIACENAVRFVLAALANAEYS